MNSGVPTDSEGPGSNPFEEIFLFLCYFFNPFFTLFFTFVVHIASKKLHV